MKNKLSLLPCLALSVTLLFQSCIKEAVKQIDEAQQKKEEAEFTAHSNDQAMMSGEMDVVTNELNIPLETIETGRSQSQQGATCSMTIVYDTANAKKTATITYDGDDCPGFRTRKGVVEVSIPAGTRWSDVGAEVTVTYRDLKITRKSDKRYIVLNGTHKIKNVEGGLILMLAFNLKTSIVHSISSSDMSVKFDDGTARTWSVARKRVYTYSPNTQVATVTITGNHQNGNQSGIAEWGTDRFGINFTTSITQPLVISSACQYRVTGGQIKHERAGGSGTLTLGLNDKGEPVSCPSGSYYFKIIWTGALGHSYTYIGAY